VFLPLRGRLHLDQAKAESRGLAETTAGTAVTVKAALRGPTASEGVVGFVKSLATEKGVARRLKMSLSRRPVPAQFFSDSQPRRDRVCGCVRYESIGICDQRHGRSG
jgi:hypothetical protein